MAELTAPYRDLADPSAFNAFLSGEGLLSDRNQMAEEYDYDWHARKLDFERHFRSLVLLHITRYRSARDLSWAADEDLLFKSLKADFNISVSGFGDAMADRPIEPYWQDALACDGCGRRASAPPAARPLFEDVEGYHLALR